jgi:ribosomal protein S18 acetylase RimI-like enzyme
MALDPDDDRWQVPSWDPLGASSWYLDQSLEDRIAIGLFRTVAFLNVGVEFECTLQEGLLKYAATLPDGHPSFRYAYHEIIEEANHSMMFREFIARSGHRAPRAAADVTALYARVVALATESPILFFLSVMAGEEAFDYFQRRMLDAADQTHPLLARMNAIHIAEEARHLSFARAFVRHAVRDLPDRDVRKLRYQTPFVVEWTAGRMFELPPALVERWGVPDDVQREVADGDLARSVRRTSMRRLVGVCRKVGILDERMAPTWARLGFA